ncbi:carboxylic acid reductase [soil metagenome]
MAIDATSDTKGHGGPDVGQHDELTSRITKLRADDPQFADAFPLESVAAAVSKPALPVSKMLAAVMEGYADRPAVGQRVRELLTDSASGRTSVQLRPEFDTLKYGELWRRATSVAAQWHHDPTHPFSAGEVVAILGFTSVDYTVIELACIQLGAVSVPLQTSGSTAQHVAILGETQPQIIAVGIDYLAAAVDAALAGDAPARIVVFDYDARDDDQREKFDTASRRLGEAASPVRINTLDAVITRGAESPAAPLFAAAEGENPLLTLTYTSGSTGTPKGVMGTERAFRGMWLPQAKIPSITLSYLPMSHSYGRSQVFTTLAAGGTVYFTARSDMSTLLDDLALVRPTSLSLVPRICEMLFQRYLSDVDRYADNGTDPADIEGEVKKRLRDDVLGGRVLSAFCGSAPLPTETAAFVESMLGLHLIIGYGASEIGSVLLDSQVQRPPVIDYKLVDVPELGYFHTDKPYPRGELVVKTEQFMDGYYKRPELTADMLDADGYYKTSDIMAQIGPDRLVFVDRRNNVVKLAQGEFVAVSRLESLYTRSPEIAQIYVYGSGERSFLLAVVVPDDDLIAQLSYGEGTEQVQSIIGRALNRVAADNGLNGYEIPRKVVLETEPFTQENGLLTGIGKPQRPNLKARYGDRLEALYTELAEGQISETKALRAGGADRPVLETVLRAVQAILGVAPADVDADAKFSDLGGDSLSALSFSNLLQDIFGIEVPVGVIINPASDLTRLAGYVEEQRSSGAVRPTFGSVHGAGSTEVYARDITLDKFIDTETLQLARSLPEPDGSTDTVLLTGATGFLGSRLTLEWLERQADAGGKLICIARGADAAQARQRIESALDTDPKLSELFRTLAAEHLEVLPGDLGEPHLGLDADTWSRLAGSVDLIVHPAAHVNHVLPYHQLFGANVVGTAELIRLALTTKLKSINFVSSMGVTTLLNELIEEDADIREAVAVAKLDDGYGNGYALTKWAGEILMREVNDWCGLPVAVFRSGMILADQQYAGLLNVPDIFTRLLLTVISTGVAPTTFYAANGAQGRPRANYAGLTVDFLARSIAELGASTTAGVLRTYNTDTGYDDGISLDTIVDWLIDADFHILRIDEYSEWVARCETAMRALPEQQRQHSLINVMDAYRSPQQVAPGNAVPSQQFQAAVRAAGLEPPHMSKTLIDKYVSDLKLLHLV